MITEQTRQSFLATLGQSKPHKHLIKGFKSDTGSKFLAYKVMGLDKPFEFVIRHIDGRYSTIETNDFDYMARLMVEHGLYASIEDSLDCLSQWCESCVH